MHDPTGNEPSALVDPPIEGPGGNAGLAHDLAIPFKGSATIRNGNLVIDLSQGVLSFFRVSSELFSPLNTLILKPYLRDTTDRISELGVLLPNFRSPVKRMNRSTGSASRHVAKITR